MPDSGGAHAGTAAANVNLIQPREKRKAFNKMKPVCNGINTAHQGRPVVHKPFRSGTIGGKSGLGAWEKHSKPPYLHRY